MTASSATVAPTPSNAPQAGLRAVVAALSAAPLGVLADAIAKDDSTVCRIRSEETKVTFSDAIRLLYAAGFKTVPIGKVCVDRETYHALTTIAQKAMAMPDVAQRLVWDEDQG